MQTRKIRCIVCPIGCEMTAKTDNKTLIALDGNACKRGEAYARTELTDPRRMLTTTMCLRGGGRIAVKSSQPLPKARMMDCMAVIKRQTAQPPVCIGDVLISDICGTGVDIVATSRASGL